MEIELVPRRAASCLAVKLLSRVILMNMPVSCWEILIADNRRNVGSFNHSGLPPSIFSERSVFFRTDTPLKS